MTITKLDCSGKTSYEIGTKYKDSQGDVFKFGFDDRLTEEDIVQFNIKPSWTNVNDRDSVLICGTPIKAPSSTSDEKNKSKNDAGKKRKVAFIIPSVLLLAGVVYLTYRAIKK